MLVRTFCNTIFTIKQRKPSSRANKMYFAKLKTYGYIYIYIYIIYICYIYILYIVYIYMIFIHISGVFTRRER